MESVWYAVVFLGCVVAASDIYPCPLEVAENSKDVVLECRGIAANEQVSWQRSKGATMTDVGACDPLPGSCLSKLPDLMTLSRPSAEVSRLTISSADRSLYGAANFTCTTFASSAVTGSSSCPMDVVYNAEVSNCSVAIVRDGNAWVVTASCSIDKVFSSLHRYTCQLLQQTEAGENRSVANSTFTPTLSDINGTTYGSGVCVLTAPLHPDSSVYTVLVNPGATRTHAGNITPVLPATTPTLTCSPHEGQYVAENGDITCACSVSDLGEPPGQLLGYRDDVLLATGSLGDNRLTFPVQTLGRHDNGTVFRCVIFLGWAKPAEQRVVSNLSVSVAYGPEKVELFDPGTFEVHPSFRSTVTLTCNVTSASPSVTFSWQGPCAGHEDSTCTFAPSVADDGKPVTCVVQNKFNNIIKGDSRILKLNYPPQDAPIISGYDGSPLQPGQSLLLSCDVDGGRPKVTALTFTCQGQGQEVLGQSSTVNVTVEAGNHGDECVCTARWKRPGWYTQRAAVKLVVLQPAEIASLTVNDTSGIVTLNESADDTLVLSCVARGVPSPPLRLLRGGEVLVAKRGQLTTQRSTRLTARLPARCESSATYTCTAEDAGQQLRANVTLDVLCAPRLARDAEEMLILEIDLRTTTNLTFHLESNPPPSTFTFNRDFDGAFNVICSKTAMRSRHACVITVTTVAEAEEGVHVLDIENALGHTLARFNLSRGKDSTAGPASSSARENSAPSVTVIVLSTLLGLVLIACVAITVCYVRERRRAKPADDGCFTLHVNDSYGQTQGGGNKLPTSQQPKHSGSDGTADDYYLTPQQSSNAYELTPGPSRHRPQRLDDATPSISDTGYIAMNTTADSSDYENTQNQI